MAKLNIFEFGTEIEVQAAKKVAEFFCEKYDDNSVEGIKIDDKGSYTLRLVNWDGWGDYDFEVIARDIEEHQTKTGSTFWEAFDLICANEELDKEQIEEVKDYLEENGVVISRRKGGR